MLSDFRSATHRLLVEQDLLPVREFVPDDLAELPCIVLGAPSLGDGDEQGTYDLTLPVYVVGRRFGDDDAQDELTRYTDQTITIFGGTRGRRAHHHNFAVVAASPEVRSAGGTDVPVYLLTVTSTAITC